MRKSDSSPVGWSIHDPIDKSVGDRRYNVSRNGAINVLPKSLVRLISGSTSVGFSHLGLDSLDSIRPVRLVGGGKRFGGATFISEMETDRIYCMSSARPGHVNVIEACISGRIMNQETNRYRNLYISVVGKDGRHDPVDHTRLRWLPTFRDNGLCSASRFMSTCVRVEAVPEYELHRYSGQAGYDSAEQMITHLLDISGLGQDPDRWWWVASLIGVLHNKYAAEASMVIDKPRLYSELLAGVGPRSTTEMEKRLLYAEGGPGTVPKPASFRRTLFDRRLL